MSLLSREDVEKFQAIYKKQFGNDISHEDAYDGGAKLVRLMKIIYRPMTLEEYEMVQKRRLDTEKTN